MFFDWLPDADTLLWSDIHLVGLFDVEGFIPFSEVTWLHVSSKDDRGVNVD